VANTFYGVPLTSIQCSNNDSYFSSWKNVKIHTKVTNGWQPLLIFFPSYMFKLLFYIWDWRLLKNHVFTQGSIRTLLDLQLWRCNIEGNNLTMSSEFFRVHIQIINTYLNNYNICIQSNFIVQMGIVEWLHCWYNLQQHSMWKECFNLGNMCHHKLWCFK
jgi:hypothetical protein